MRNKQEPVIECRGLLKKYGRHNVLNGVDLSVPPGVIYALLGTNGAGKTTLIRSLLGLMPHSGGKIEILGEDPWQAGPSLRQRIGYVSEEQGLYGWMTVAQLISFCKGLYPKWNNELVDKYMERFALSPKKRIRTMSKGQKVRLALILALAPEPDLLILDEPMSGLDPLAQHQFLQIIRQDAIAMKHTIFFSTHDLPDVEAIATHVAILNDGVIRIAGTIEEIERSILKLRLPTKDAANLPPDSFLLTQDSDFTTTLIPNISNAETAFTGISSSSVITEPATLQEVFLYFCTRRDSYAPSEVFTL